MPHACMHSIYTNYGDLYVYTQTDGYSHREGICEVLTHMLKILWLLFTLIANMHLCVHSYGSLLYYVNGNLTKAEDMLLRALEVSMCSVSYIHTYTHTHTYSHLMCINGVDYVIL